MTSDRLERHVSRLKEGDAGAFDYIYEHTHRAVYFAVFYILRDKMLAEDGSPFTAHTTNLVPFIVANYPCKLRDGGRLCDIAPTMLQILGLPQPKEMTGVSMIEK